MRDPMSGIVRKLKPGFCELPIDKIGSDGGRSINKKHVKALSESIAVDGLLCPISVTTDSKIVCGRHRLHACRLLGWKRIPAVVVDFDAMHAELAEIDENVVRKDLSAIERSKALARRKELYEALHPETAKGTAGAVASNAKQGKGNATDNVSVASFAADTAAKTGQSERQVRRDVAIGIGVPDDVVAVIADTKLANNKKQLTELAKLDADKQRAVAKKIADGAADTVTSALKEHHPVADDHCDDDQDADGGAEPVTSGPLAGMEPDPVGVDSEPTTCEAYTTRLVEWTRKQFCNIDGLTWGCAMSVWARLSELSADQLDAM